MDDRNEPSLHGSAEPGRAPAEPVRPAGGPAGATAAAAPVPPTAAEAALERLAGELLRERRIERRWSVALRLAWLGLVVAVLAVLWGSRAHVATTSAPHTALVEVRGTIDAETEASAEVLLGALKMAFQDPGAQAVVLRINSPGGSPVQAGILNDEIRRLKALHGKKVYAVVEDICASGAYYVAAAADEIFVDKASLVGSVGVLMDGFGFVGAMEKLGIERRLLTAGVNKGMLDPFSPQNPQHDAFAREMLAQIHQQFIKVVREGRGKRLKETPELFSGLVWNGEDAVRLGLADRFGNLDFVAREVVKAEEIVDYTPRENVAERLAKRFGAGMAAGVVRAAREAAPALR
jgi:protease-4